MTQAPKTQEPLLGQIIDMLIDSLSEHKDFDAAILEELQKLAKAGNLKKTALVTKAIRVETGATK